MIIWIEKRTFGFRDPQENIYSDRTQYLFALIGGGQPLVSPADACPFGGRITLNNTHGAYLRVSL